MIKSHITGIRRGGTRSQALVEFAFFVTIIGILILGLLTFGLRIMYIQTIAVAVREGASTASRANKNNMQTGLDAAANICYRDLPNMSNNGGIIISLVQRPTAANAVRIVTPDNNSVLSTGNLWGGGDALKNNSKILLDAGGGPWQNLPRKLPFPATDLVIGKNLYVVEVYYSNDFVNTINKLIGINDVTNVLQDRAYFVSQ